VLHNAVGPVPDSATYKFPSGPNFNPLGYLRPFVITSIVAGVVLLVLLSVLSAFNALLVSVGFISLLQEANTIIKLHRINLRQLPLKDVCIIFFLLVNKNRAQQIKITMGIISR
jgi:hypothetical protein